MPNPESQPIAPDLVNTQALPSLPTPIITNPKSKSALSNRMKLALGAGLIALVVLGVTGAAVVTRNNNYQNALNNSQAQTQSDITSDELQTVEYEERVITEEGDLAFTIKYKAPKSSKLEKENVGVYKLIGSDEEPFELKIFVYDGLKFSCLTTENPFSAAVCSVITASTVLEVKQTDVAQNDPYNDWKTLTTSFKGFPNGNIQTLITFSVLVPPEGQVSKQQGMDGNIGSSHIDMGEYLVQVFLPFDGYPQKFESEDVEKVENGPFVNLSRHNSPYGFSYFSNFENKVSCLGSQSKDCNSTFAILTKPLEDIKGFGVHCGSNIPLTQAPTQNEAEKYVKECDKIVSSLSFKIETLAYIPPKFYPYANGAIWQSNPDPQIYSTYTGNEWQIRFPTEMQSIEDQDRAFLAVSHIGYCETYSKNSNDIEWPTSSHAFPNPVPNVSEWKAKLGKGVFELSICTLSSDIGNIQKYVGLATSCEKVADQTQCGLSENITKLITIPKGKDIKAENMIVTNYKSPNKLAPVYCKEVHAANKNGVLYVDCRANTFNGGGIRDIELFNSIVKIDTNNLIDNSTLQEIKSIQYNYREGLVYER